jgi:limonene-1,2-epoxide hydrolase
MSTQKSDATSPKQIVTDFINAVNNEDWSVARELVTDDFVFDGVLGHRDGADNYFEDMKRMKFKYEIQKIIGDHEDAAVKYNIQMGAKTIFTCGWYHVKNGRINSLKVVFDPRPVLEGQ